MSYTYNENYFMASLPNIYGNTNLREPQLEAYIRTQEYFSNNPSNRSALIVLPTGVGKTGVMGLVPFGLCKKRVLLITPGMTIKDTVTESLNPYNPDNFWYKTNIFNSGYPLPNIIEYEGSDTPLEVLEASNIVIINVQKLQSRHDSSLINRVDNTFFDLIIIDEAHHSTASTWVECINYFELANIIKLTGTPFRTDKEKITGTLVYKYPLSRAMAKEYVKSLSNIEYSPDELRLTIDNNKSKTYTVDEIYELGLKDKEWVTRSVAYSLDCSQAIVDQSIEALKNKLINSSVPHKIIAIACSIEHAKQISELYENRGIKTAILHSDLTKEEKDIAFKNIENNRVQAVINVAMLGEGYDHKYLSIAAIFRPFRNELPYTQFIGRVLRIIPEGSAKDNVAKIISHEHLYLNSLWKKYKKEIQESEIIKSLKDYEDVLDDDDQVGTSRGSNLNQPLGYVKQSFSHSLKEEDYLTTELIKKSIEAEKEIDIKVQYMIKEFNMTEEQAKFLIQQTQNMNSSLGRPDILYKRKKKGLDETIREEIVPRLIESNNIDKDNDDLANTQLFTDKYWYIPSKLCAKNKSGKNAAMLAMYYNNALKDKIGYSRKNWTDDDFDIAFNYLDTLTKYIDGVIKNYYNIK